MDAVSDSSEKPSLKTQHCEKVKQQVQSIGTAVRTCVMDFYDFWRRFPYSLVQLEGENL